MKGLITVILFITISYNISAQIDLSRSRIVIDNSIGTDSVAASLLQYFMAEISHKNIPIIATKQFRERDIKSLGKVKIETILKCPLWHYGFGTVAWCFIDELTIKR